MKYFYKYRDQKAALFSLMPDFLKKDIEIFPDILIEYKKEKILYTVDAYNLSADLTERELVPIYTNWTFNSTLSEYVNRPYEESIKLDDKYNRLFVLLDKRTGKRTLRKYRDNGDFLESVRTGNLPLEKLYKIRFKEANISIDDSIVELTRIIGESED